MFARKLLTQPDTFAPSSSWHQISCKNVNVALVDYLFQAFLCFKYALRGMCHMRILISYRNFENKLDKCITNGAEWKLSSVLHCNVTDASWRRENTRDVCAAL